MKLSAKARYGLYAAVHLAKKYDNGLVNIAELSQATAVSQKYLEQILSLLKGGGVVDSQRGAAGGYILSASPDKITVGQVLRAVEDELRIVHCLHTDCKNDCDCESKRLWNSLYRNINDYLDSISLYALITGGI